MGIAIAAASRKATQTRIVEIKACQRRPCVVVMVHIALSTLLGAGRNCAWMTPARATSSHASIRAAATPRPSTKSVRALLLPRNVNRLVAMLSYLVSTALIVVLSICWFEASLLSAAPFSRFSCMTVSKMSCSLPRSHGLPR